MSTLAHDQWRRVYDSVKQIGAVAQVQDFHQHTLAAVDSLLPHTVVSSELHDLSVLEIVSSSQTRNDDFFLSMMPAFAAHLNEHPCVEAAMKTRQLNVMGVLDRMAPAAFENLGLYNEFYRHVDIRDQIIIARSQGFPSLLALAVSRDERFSPEERQMLELFAPALADAHDNWVCLQKAKGKNAWALGALEHLHCGGMHIGMAGVIHDFNDLAQDLIRRYLGVRQLGATLPNVLADWYGPSLAEPLARRRPLIRETEEGKVEFRLIDTYPGGGWLILCREQPRVVNLDPLKDLGLSQSLAEVLHLCCRDMTYKEIAKQLGKSPRTVGTQMERVLSKLGVKDKAAAVAVATGALSNPLNS